MKNSRKSNETRKSVISILAETFSKAFHCAGMFARGPMDSRIAERYNEVLMAGYMK